MSSLPARVLVSGREAVDLAAVLAQAARGVAGAYGSTAVPPPRVRFIDASWYLPAHNRDAAAEFAARRLPGAVRFDIDALSDASSPLPHMLPPARAFCASMAALGLSRDDELICYDGAGVFSSPRAWWTLRAFGARRARVLDGGLPAFVAAGGALEVCPPPPPPPRLADEDAGWALDGAFVASMADVRAASASASAGAPPAAAAPALLDARPAARFEGAAPEPRPGLRAGHVPRARSLPYSSLLDGATGTFLPPDRLAAAFAAAGVDARGPRSVIASCGSGVTACVIAAALAVLGRPLGSGEGAVKVYDGSWAEWGSEAAAAAGCEVETGPAQPLS